MGVYGDHLGNIRLSFSDKDKDGQIDVLRNNTDIDGDNDYANEILEEKNYYPFGLQHKGYNNTITGREHPYGYNNKEEQNELGLNWLDYGARNYDATLGRWMNVDPLAEKYNKISPYVYVANKPIVAFDPDGRKIIYAGETKKEQREFKRELKSRLKSQFAKSKEFRKVWRTLKNSKKEYRFKVEKSAGLGQFVPTTPDDINKSHLLEMGDDGNWLNPEVAATNPDRAGGDIYISEEAWNDSNLGANVIVEEIMHAAQFDNTVSLGEARNFDYSKWTVPEGSGNREFEAKMMTGIINHAAGIPFFSGYGNNDGSVTREAQQFGVQFIQNGGGSTSYFKNMKKWQKTAQDKGNTYGSFRFDKTPPTILKL